MADNIITPVTAGTIMATKDIGGAQFAKNLLNDTAGADAMGLVTASPDANSLLGRLKAIVDAIIARLPTLGVKAATGSLSVTPSSDGFAITATVLPLPAGASTAANQAAGNPADSAAAVTPSDTTDLATVPKALYIGGAGNIVLRGSDSVNVTFAVQACQILPLRARRVLATGTTATGIIALY